jgi:hypothetical protein
MNDIIEKVYHGFNNHYDLKNNFYDYLSKELRNEPNKIEFLNQLILKVESEYPKEQQKCNKQNCECKLELKNNAIKIMKSKIQEIEERGKPTLAIDNSVNKNVVQGSTGVYINQNSNNNINSEDKKESWVKRNIKYIYYTAGVIAFGYAFYKWLLPLI